MATYEEIFEVQLVIYAKRLFLFEESRKQKIIVLIESSVLVQASKPGQIFFLYPTSDPKGKLIHVSGVLACQELWGTEGQRRYHQPNFLQRLRLENLQGDFLIMGIDIL